MKNPPDFVVYVVMVKGMNDANFGPRFRPNSGYTPFAFAYATRRDAWKELRYWRNLVGKENAYVQQYGPYK